MGILQIHTVLKPCAEPLPPAEEVGTFFYDTMRLLTNLIDCNRPYKEQTYGSVEGISKSLQSVEKVHVTLHRKGKLTFIETMLTKQHVYLSGVRQKR